MAARTSGAARGRAPTPLPGAAAATPLRVLVVAPEPFYEDRGTPIAVRQLVTAASSLGHSVDLLTYPVGRELALPRVRVLRSANPFRIRAVPIGLSARKILLDVPLGLALARLVRSGRYDLVHAVEEAAFAAALVAPPDVAVVYDMQSSIPEQLALQRGLRNRPTQSLLRRCERWLLRRATVVVGSSGLLRLVRAERRERPSLDWRYVPYERLPDPADGAAVRELRRDLAIPAGAPVALYVGSFAAYQGVGLLLEAAPRLRGEHRDAHLVLVGAGLDALAASPPAGVRVVPRQSRDDLPRWLGLADVLVSVRTHGRNAPLKIFDYLAAGRPIVATDGPAHRSLLDESRALLVPPTAAGLAAGIGTLFDDRELATKLADAGRRWAERELGWPTFLRAVDHLYEVARREIAPPRPRLAPA